MHTRKETLPVSWKSWLQENSRLFWGQRDTRPNNPAKMKFSFNSAQYHQAAELFYAVLTLCSALHYIYYIIIKTILPYIDKELH